MPEETVFNRITHEYYQLTASEKKLATFVVANGQRSQTMSISELAAACGVAEATISRFCRRMGYQGYSAFRLAIAAATAARENSDPPAGGSHQAGDARPRCEGHAVQHRLAAVGFAQVFHTQFHQPPTFRTSVSSPRRNRRSKPTDSTTMTAVQAKRSAVSKKKTIFWRKQVLFSQRAVGSQQDRKNDIHCYQD